MPAGDQRTAPWSTHAHVGTGQRPARASGLPEQPPHRADHARAAATVSRLQIQQRLRAIVAPDSHARGLQALTQQRRVPPRASRRAAVCGPAARSRSCSRLTGRSRQRSEPGSSRQARSNCISSAAAEAPAGRGQGDGRYGATTDPMASHCTVRRTSASTPPSTSPPIRCKTTLR